MANLIRAPYSVICNSNKHAWSCVTVLVLASHAVLVLRCASLHAPTVNEPMHLAAGVWRLQNGHFDQDIGNPPLVGMVAAIPAAFAASEVEWVRYPGGFGIGDEFVNLHGAKIISLIEMGRWALVPFTIICGYVCFCWGRDLYGPAAGATALFLRCFDPTILAHGSLVTADMAATACSAAACYVYWRWLRQPSPRRACLAGVVLGAAELAKFTCVVLYPIFVVLWLIACFRPGTIVTPARSRTPSTLGDSEGTVRRMLWRSGGQLLGILFLSVYFLNLGYGFERSCEQLGSFEFQSRRLAWLNRSDVRATTAGGKLKAGLQELPVPLPYNYVMGIDAVAELADVPSRETYLRGEWRSGGFRYYYLYGFLVKLPLGTWILIGLSVISAALFRPSPKGWFDDACLILPGAVFVGFVSWATGLQFFRYVLPAYPFLFIWLSKMATLVTWPRAAVAFQRSDDPSDGNLKPHPLPTATTTRWGNNVLFQGKAVQWIVNSVVLGSLLWSAASSVCIYPHCGSYFNQIAGGPLRGHEHFVSSEMDWGQDLLYLKKWLVLHPDATPLHLKYVGGIDARLAGIEYHPIAASEPSPGWHGLSVTCLHGGCSSPSRRTEFAHFLKLTPVAMAGYSIYIYYLTVDDANRLRREMGLPTVPESDAGARHWNSNQNY